MNSDSPQHWREQKEQSNKFMLSLLYWFALHSPRIFLSPILIATALFFTIFKKHSVNTSKDYWQHLEGHPPSFFKVTRHFYHFAQVSIDRLYFLSGRYKQFRVDTEGKDLFTEKSGGLLLVSHIGSFDSMRVLAKQESNLDIYILMDRQHNAKAMQLIERLSPEMANKIIDVAQPPSQLALHLDELIKQGAYIGIMGDRVGRNETHTLCDFLGQPAQLPLGPWQLAATLKVPVIMCTGLYHGNKHYSLHFELLYEGHKITRKERHKVLHELAQKYAQRLEHYIKLAPYNWFNFYNFWSNERT
ncbi:hypothetical protein [Agaribacterium sp. ZY112]|uniref:LpxL/LpxP family acyltransferase n=1 Tax=Agaribacterium sp. ZY112 TaxID=3233574 RepID=UPI003523CF10